MDLFYFFSDGTCRGLQCRWLLGINWWWGPFILRQCRDCSNIRLLAYSNYPKFAGHLSLRRRSIALFDILHDDVSGLALFALRRWLQDD